MAEDEHRRPTPGFPDYWVTKTGNVWSDKSKRWLKPGICKQGYRRFALTVEGCVKQYKAAFLVLLTFVGLRPEGQFVRHLNDVSNDDRLENLAYGTRLQNAEDAKRNGVYARRKMPKRGATPALRGSKHGNSKLTEDDVCDLYVRFHRGERGRLLAEEFGITEGNVYAICTKRVSWRWLTEILDAGI